MQVKQSSNLMRHYDYGYAVTSHSSQGLTAELVLVNMDMGAPGLQTEGEKGSHNACKDRNCNSSALRNILCLLCKYETQK